MTGPAKDSFARRLRTDVHAAWLAARDRRTPWHARALALLVTAYALSPIDLIPDFIPVLGLLDDVVLIPAGLWLFVRLVPAELWTEHRAAALAAMERPSSIWGLALVVLVWGASLLICARWTGII